MITITIKGIPKETHRELKKRAVTHGRSLNTEAIAVLESSVRSVPVDSRGNYSAGARSCSQFHEVQGDGGGFEAIQARGPRVIVADNSLLVYFWLPYRAFAELAEAVKDRGYGLGFADFVALGISERAGGLSAKKSADTRL